jgi:hypothetical protein
MAQAIGSTASTPGKFSLTPVYWVVLAAYTLLVFYGTSNHEPWRDEALSWLMCRDMPLGDLFKFLPMEGAPPLWYVLILPLAKTGAPYIAQSYLATAIMVATAWLLLFRTSLPVYLKVALLFSYFFIYQYAEFARNYCLLPFFTVAIIALYPLRFSKPWLFAGAVIGLFNSHVLAFTFAGGIALLYAIDALELKQLKGRVLGGFVAMAIGGGYLIPYFLLRAPTINAYAERITDHSNEMVKALGNAFFTYKEVSWGVMAFIIISVCLVVRPKAFLALALGAAGFFYILGYKYIGAARHQGMIMVIVVGAIGLAYYYRSDRWNPKLGLDGARFAAIAFSLTLLVQIKSGLEVWNQDNEETYSDGKGAAEYLLANEVADKLVIAHRSYAAFSVLPYLPKDIRFFYPECMRTGSFVLDDSCHLANQFLPQDYAVYVTDTLYFKPGQKPPKEVVLLLNGPIQEPQLAKDWKLVYQTPQETLAKDEQFFIYRR